MVDTKLKPCGYASPAALRAEVQRLQAALASFVALAEGGRISGATLRDQRALEKAVAAIKGDGNRAEDGE